VEALEGTNREGHREPRRVAYSRRAGSNGARGESADRRLVAAVAIAAEVFVRNARLGM